MKLLEPTGGSGEGTLKVFTPSPCLMLTMSVPMQMRTMAIGPSGRGTLAMMKKRNGVSSGMLAASA